MYFPKFAVFGVHHSQTSLILIFYHRNLRHLRPDALGYPPRSWGYSYSMLIMYSYPQYLYISAGDGLCMGCAHRCIDYDDYGYIQTCMDYADYAHRLSALPPS